MIFASLQGLGEDFKGCQSSGPGTQPVYTGESEADFCPADGSTLLSPAFVSHFRDLPLAVPIIPNATDSPSHPSSIFQLLWALELAVCLDLNLGPSLPAV